ncbi:MAG: hypothetical protein IBX47_04000 [Desulfuromonadales bacterium]|nr:hypothetical protein [Desulfuromonadales bacterium]
MSRIQKSIIITLAALLIGHIALAEEASREQIKGLDEQVQEIKGDVLSIATELKLLEEKLLYPSNTQVTIFVSLADGEKFRLDSLDLTLDNKAVAHHLYTFKELEALRKGGVQRLYTGNISTGEHPLVVSFYGKTDSGSDIEKTGSFTVNKNIGPGIVEIILAEQMISFSDK